MRSVAWTDVVQGILLLIGCAGILYVLVTSDGGLTATAAAVRESAPGKLEAPGAVGLRTWISNLVLLGTGVAIYPHAIQRIFAAKNLVVLRRSLGAMAFMPLLTTLLAFLIGYVALSRFPGLTGVESDKVTIYVLGGFVGESPATYWLVVFVLVAVVAAIMSTADSALLSLGSMLTKDIYKAYFKREASPRQMLIVGKTLSWLIMGLLIAMAWVSIETKSSIWLLIKLKLEFMVQLAPAIVLGVHWRRLTATPVLVGMIGGTLVTLVIWLGVVGGLWESRSPLGISAGVWGLMVNLGCCAAGGLLTGPVSCPGADTRTTA